MSKTFLDRTLWTQDDLAEMSWKESRIFGIAFYPDTSEIALDVDYIFAVTEPKDGELVYTMSRAPVTLVFQNIRGIELSFGFLETNINTIEKHVMDKATARGLDTERFFEWCIDCYHGEIRLIATGFQAYVRKAPQVGGFKSLGDRDGICFDRHSY